jgi:CheY-like chemotaxis protein
VRRAGAGGTGEWGRAETFSEFAAALGLGAALGPRRPRAAAAPPPPPAARPASAPAAAAPAPARPPDPVAPAPTPLVMIVDDERDLCEVIDYHAKKAGFRTVLAHSGQEASAKLADEEPSLIVLDLMMPGQNGYEFLREMSAAGFGRIPVSVMTGRRMNASALALIREEKNVVEILLKPFAVDQLIESLRRRLKAGGGGARPAA